VLSQPPNSSSQAESRAAENRPATSISWWRQQALHFQQIDMSVKPNEAESETPAAPAVVQPLPLHSCVTAPLSPRQYAQYHEMVSSPPNNIVTQTNVVAVAAEVESHVVN
jgi:hypothetical protein